MTTPLACLTCRERIGSRRGVCPRCLARHQTAIRQGKTTWAALEAAGKILPAQAVGHAWRLPTRDTVRTILTHPIYASYYRYGQPPASAPR